MRNLIAANSARLKKDKFFWFAFFLMLGWSVLDYNGPVAVRYPRGSEGAYQGHAFTGIPGDFCCHRKGKDITIVTYGTIINKVLEAAQLLEQAGIDVTILRLFSTTNIPYEELSNQITGKNLIVVEEACSGSGIKEAFAWYMRDYAPDCTVHAMDLGSEFIPHGDLPSLFHMVGLDAEGIVGYVQEVLSHEK